MKHQEDYFDQYKSKLHALLIYSAKHIDYYRDNWDFVIPEYEAFTYEFYTNTVPILEKKIVRENSEAILDKSVHADMLSIDSTSGTEGKPIICYRSKKERFMCSNSLWHLRRRFIKDLRPADKFASFYAFRNKDKQVLTNQVLLNENKILLPLFELSDQKLIYYWNEIIKFQPRWMHGPSSTIYSLALAVQKYKLQPYAFEFIELSGEYVQKEHEDYIQEIFQCKTANQYGCREYWPMAYSDTSARLQVVTDNIFMEQIYNSEHRKCELLITLLKNNTWPLIRYRLEDLGELCFENEKVYINLFQGRKAEFFILGENKRFNAIVFSGLARAVCELYGYNAIYQFQIIKTGRWELKIKLRLNERSEADVMDRYQQEIQKIVGSDINIVVERVPYIEPDPVTGKTKEFIELTN